MNKKMSRYKGLILSCVSVLMIVVCVCSFSFESKASDDFEFYLDYPEPATSESQGYITILLYSVVDEEYQVCTFFWNTYAVASGQEGVAEAYITLTDSSIEFNVSTNGATSVQYTLYEVTTENFYRMRAHSSSSKYTQNFSPNYEVFGWKVVGNGYVSSSSLMNFTEFSAYYSDDGVSKLLYDIIYELSYANSNDVLIKSVLQSILNSVDGVENQLSSVVNYLKSIDDDLVDIKDELEEIFAKADEILKEEEKQTSWLEKIWNSIQEFLGMQSSDDVEEMEGKEESAEMQKKEDELLNQDISGATDNLDVEIDANSSGTIWAMVENIMSTNNKYFTTVISILALGIVALILGR